MAFARLYTFSLLGAVVVGQQIWDVWQTTWDRSSLFTNNSPTTPYNFVTPGPADSADIVVDDSQVFQQIYGFGATLTDSSALLMSQLKTTNVANYWSVLGYLFDPTDGNGGAGLSYLRVPMGASDFSADTYTYDTSPNDNSLSDFNINNAPDYVFETINDIQSINQYLRVHVVPWSPPGWMKTSGTMDGGSLNAGLETEYANYLLKALQGFQSHGITPFAISIQNEPENSDGTYPSCSMPVETEATIGLALRTLMDDNGFTDTKLIGYEHNWSDAGGYPVQLMQQAGSAFDGVSFHCYAGDFEDQATFSAQYPDKEIFFTECTGTIGSDWWSDIKWYMDNIFTGAVNYGASTGLMWNLALDGSGQPELPGSDSCSGGNPGCRGVVQINSDGSYSVNQEFYAMAQVSKATVPKDVGGPFGQRIGVTVDGSLDWSLIVGAFVTNRIGTDYLRYSLVVLNWDDSSTTVWNPVDVTATIEFRGAQATFTFPVGVTTLWWFAD